MQPGDKLGSYEILSALARGDAGESWRARDARVGREVALHVLPEAAAVDESRRLALDHRARVLASLDHPAVARVYGLEEADGTWFLVTEPVGGETLAERLGRGPLPIEEALTLGLGLARGLAAAHEKDIVHRDLNPSKIRITNDGQAKIMDFPLASVTASGASDLDMSQSPTLGVTGSAALPGTPACMSPEQARGEAAGAASDVWAFGCVLFQMLSGQPAFEGETDSDLLASVLRNEPDWDRLPGGLHPRVRYALERCLEKPVGDRSPDLTGVAADIEATLEDPEGAAARVVAAPARLSWIPWAAALVVAGVLAGVAGWALTSAEDAGVVRFGMATPSGLGTPARVLQAVSPELGISRDGSRVVFRGRDGGIYIRDLGDVTPRPVQIAEETGLRTEPVFSPDGDELLYVDHPDGGVSLGGPLLYVSPEMAGFAGGLGAGAEFGLKRVRVDGGTPTPVLTAWPAEILDVSWNRDGTILFVDARGSVMTLPADGGTPVTLIEESGARHPQLLPGGESLLFSMGPNLVSRAATGVSGTSQIVVRSLADPDDRRVIWEGGSQPRYLEETGQIVYQGTTEPGLWAFTFDLGRLEKTGDPVHMVEGPIVDFDVSDTGSLAYALAVDLSVEEAGASSVLVLSDRAGNIVRRLRTDPGPYQNPRVSPDGTRVAYQFVDTSGQSHIWVYDLTGDFPRRLTSEGRNTDPVWKDDQHLTFASEREGAWGVYTQAVDGSEAAVQLIAAPEGTVYRPQAWASPNGPGETLVLSVTNPGEVRSGSLAMLDPDSQVTPIERAEPGAAEFGATLSPDATLLAYIQECGSFPPCVRFHRFPPVPGASVEISTAAWVSFSPDGTELVSLINQSTLGVRDVVSGGAVEFPISGSIPLGGPFGVVTNRSFDLRGPAGDELVILIPESQTGDAGEDQGIDAISSQIDFFHNFVDVLKERVLPSENRQAAAPGTSQ